MELIISWLTVKLSIVNIVKINFTKLNKFISFGISQVLFISFFTLISCTTPKDRLKPALPAQNKAPENIENSFEVKNENKNPASLQNLKNFHVSIYKSSLNKFFLMAPSIVDFTSTPRVIHLKPKVVYFNVMANNLALFEADSRLVYNDIAQNKLIQTFPIKNETDNSIEFDLKLGFTNISFQKDIGRAEKPSTPSQTEDVLTPIQSYIESAKVENNGLTIKQNSRVHSDKVLVNILNLLPDSPSQIQTSEANYIIQTRITPYKINKNFEPKVITALDMKHVGYFTTEKTEKHIGDTVSLASHWDVSPQATPITYVITKNTPPEFVEPIKEGILYWNKVFGREIIKVETDGDPQEIGSYRRNIVHWADWKKAGFSVASLQSDPFTGEILSANVYLTSAFPAIYTERVLYSAKELSDETINTLTPQGFDYDLSCALDMSKMTQGMFALIASADSKVKNNEAIIKEVQKDILREVASHEVGHTLGLRHNFAGSLSSQLLTWEDHESAFDEFINHITHSLSSTDTQNSNTEPDPYKFSHETSSSVMDYLGTKDVLMLGSHIKNNVLPYDKKAIDWAYVSKMNVDMDYSTIPFFCSDSETEKEDILDCNIFDTGRTPVSNIVQSIKLKNKNLLFEMYEKIIEAKASQQKNNTLSHKLSLKDILGKLPSPDDSAIENTKELTRVYKQFTQKAQFTFLDRLIGPANNWFETEEYQKNLLDFQLKELSKHSGNITGFISELLPLDDNFKIKTGWISSEIQKFINSPAFCSGNSITGSAIQLSAEEKNELIKYLMDYSTRYEDALVVNVLKHFAPSSLSVSNQGDNSPLKSDTKASIETVEYNPELPFENWESPIAKFVENLILDSNGTKIIKLDEQNTIETIVPTHSTLARIASLKLASQKLFKYPHWLEATVAKLSTEEIARLNALLLKSKPSDTAAESNKMIIKSNELYSLAKELKTGDFKNVVLKEIVVLNTLEQLNAKNSNEPKLDYLVKEIKE